MGLSEIFAYVIVSAFAPDFDLNAKNGLALILFMIFSKTLFLLIVYILMIVSKKQKIQQSPNDHSAPLLLLIPVASIFIILTFITIAETTLATANMNTLIYVSAFSLLLINLLVFGINQYSQKMSREFTDMQLLLQKESDLSQYYELMLSQHENQGILIHDFKKHLQSIALLNQAMDTEKIDAYIKQLLKSSDFTQTARICDNKMLNAILSRYARQCADKELAFHADVRSQSINFLENTSLTSLFSNLLDNAMEAADGIPDGFIELMVQKKENTPFVMITVINSCRKNPLSPQGELPVSRRNDSGRHGFGMKSIRKTVKRYGGDMELYYEERTHTFHALITLRDGKGV